MKPHTAMPKSIEPIHIISLGAGVQSSCMSLMAAHGEIKPMPKCAIFADTQDEPQSVYTWLDWLEKQLPFPVHRVTKGKLSEEVCRVHLNANGKKTTRSGIPYYTLDEFGDNGISFRQCTRDFKIEPLIKKAKSLAPNRESICMWIGISLDEISRIKDSSDKRITNRWPFIELKMKRHDCLLWMTRNKYPKPPRSACVFCPYHSNAEWRRLRNEEPHEFERAVQFEHKLQAAKTQVHNFHSSVFLHPSLKPLAEVDLSSEEDRGQLNMFNNECSGICGV